MCSDPFDTLNLTSGCIPLTDRLLTPLDMTGNTLNENDVQHYVKSDFYVCSYPQHGCCGVFAVYHARRTICRSSCRSRSVAAIDSTTFRPI